MKSKASKSNLSKTITTKVDVMTRNDIISIIKHCHKYQVKRLLIEGLELEFPESGVTAITSGIGAKKAQAIDEKDSSLAHREAIDTDLDILMIEDPEAFEQGLLDGALIRNGKAAQV